MTRALLLLLFIQQIALGQDIVLRLSNPAPRLDEEIKIYLRITSHYNPPDSIDYDEEKDVGDGEITLKRILSDTGTVLIGPFSLTLNDTVYKSRQIKVRVDPALPDERSGIWIRQVLFGQKSYLIIEQRIPGEWKSENSRKENEFSSTFSAKRLEFGELDLETFDRSQIVLTFRGSTSYGQAAGQKDMGGNKDTHYQRSVYEFVKQSMFKETGYEITRRNFKSLPRDIQFKKWTLK